RAPARASLAASASPTAPVAATPPPGVPPRTVVRRERETRRRSLSALAVACFLSLAAVLGYTIGANHDSTPTSASNGFPTQQIPFDPNTGQSSNGSSNGSSSGQQANIDVQAIAN